MSGDLTGRSLLLMFERGSPPPYMIAKRVGADPAEVRARLNSLGKAGYLVRPNPRSEYRLTDKGRAVVSSGQEVYA